MDAEKRHHLKQNELAEALTKLRDFGSSRQLQYWLAGIVVVLVAVIGYRSWSSWQVQRAADGWRELSEVTQKVDSNTPGALDELRGITSSSSNPTLAAVARIDLASALRAKATETGTMDTAALQDSINALKPVLDDRSLSPGIAGAAGLSLATSYESLGQFEEAERTYKVLQDEQRFAGTGYPAAAADRLKTLAELRNPVIFVAGLPPQEPPPGAMTPDALAGPPMSLTTPAEAPQASQQPAASGEPGTECGATGGDSEPGAPATQPSGNQGP